MTSSITDQLKGLKLDFTRPSGRATDQLRDIKITRGFTKHAEGSVLIEFGDTRVLCTATVERGVPRFLRGSGSGWVTAEYGMLPRATHSRNGREAARGIIASLPAPASLCARKTGDRHTFCGIIRLFF